MQLNVEKQTFHHHVNKTTQFMFTSYPSSYNMSFNTFSRLTFNYKKAFIRSNHWNTPEVLHKMAGNLDKRKKANQDEEDMMERDLAEDAVWKRIQKNTFTR